MKQLLSILSFFVCLNLSAQCLNCPSGTTAPGAAASPTVKFHGFTSEVTKYDGVKPTCYTPTANTLNGHLQGINNKLCQLKSVIDSLKTNDSSAFAQIDSIQLRIDSIVTALGQFYNTSVISSDSSVRITVTTNPMTRVNTFNLKVMDDSVGVTALNAISGNGQSYNPLKLGGTLIENTNITGDKELNIKNRRLRLEQFDENSSYYNMFDVIHNKKYINDVDLTNNRCYSFAALKTSSFENTIFTLNNVALENVGITHNLKLGNATQLTKPNAFGNGIGYGDVSNVGMGFAAEFSTGGIVESMRNLTLSPIWNGSNTTPLQIDRYISLAIQDLTQEFHPQPDVWNVPTDRYAIYQEGETDKNLFRGYFMLSNLTTYADDASAAADTSLPSSAAYLLSGSTVLHIKP